MCDYCLYDKREIWGPVKNQPILDVINNGNFISLEKCPKCSNLWVYSPYEPYSSFPYLVKWGWTIEKWESIKNIEDGKILQNWHILVIRDIYLKTKIDKEEIEFHRKRSYYNYNPIDMKIERQLDDIVKLISSL